MKRSSIAVLAFSAPCTAQAVWIVDAQAAPPGLGTPAQPYASINYGLHQPTTVDGDTVLVKPGVYREFVTTNKSVTLKSSDGALVTSIEYPAPPATGPLVDVDFATLQGFRFDGRNAPNARGLDLFSATVRECVIEGFSANPSMSYWDGVGVLARQGGFVKVERCTLARNRIALDFVYSSFIVRDSVFQSNEHWDVPPEFHVNWGMSHSIDGSLWEHLPTPDDVYGSDNILGDAGLWSIARRDYAPAHGSPAIDSSIGPWGPDPDGSPAERGAVLYDSTYAPASSVYCTAKINSEGCAGAIAASGAAASVSSSAVFSISVWNLPAAKKGLLFYGHNGRSAQPFQGGTMCVAAPRSRTPIASPTSATGPCSGTLSIDFNSVVQSGIDPELVAGLMIQSQWWYRDPADPQGFGTATSDAIEFAIGL